MQRFSVIVAVFCLLQILCACSSGSSAGKHAEAIRLKLAGTKADTFKLLPDWRMGTSQELRSGSALFFRFSYPNTFESDARDIGELHLVDPRGSQFSANYEVKTFHGSERSICVIALQPEQTYYLPAGSYSVAVEGRFKNGEAFKTTAVEFILLDKDARLADKDKLSEHERFAAHLLFSGDEESYQAVLPLLVDNLKSRESGEIHILTRLLQRYHGATVLSETGERTDSLGELLVLSDDAKLSTRERELSILALEEMYIRGQRQDR